MSTKLLLERQKEERHGAGKAYCGIGAVDEVADRRVKIESTVWRFSRREALTARACVRGCAVDLCPHNLCDDIGDGDCVRKSNIATSEFAPSTSARCRSARRIVERARARTPSRRRDRLRPAERSSDPEATATQHVLNRLSATTRPPEPLCRYRLRHLSACRPDDRFSPAIGSGRPARILSFRGCALCSSIIGDVAAFSWKRERTRAAPSSTAVAGLLEFHSFVVAAFNDDVRD